MITPSGHQVFRSLRCNFPSNEGAFLIHDMARIWVLLAIGLLAGCESVGYYSQAAIGQTELLWNSRPIAEVIADETTPDQLKARLMLVEDIRNFAESELALPGSGSYRRYTDIGRDFVIWNVVAAREFSIAPELFCFPIVGCVSYHGYFDRADADAEEARLKSQGLETEVGPVAAYSTLGWFPDPVLSSVLNYPDPELAGLIFHELAHERLYRKDNTTFNESFASFVEQTGVDRWLRRSGRTEDLEAYRTRLAKRDRLLTRIDDTRTRLADLYRMTIPVEEMRERKKIELDALTRDYLAMRKAGEAPNWGRWFEEDLNNAKLASVGTYFDRIDLFAALFEQAGGDFPSFYRLAEKVELAGDSNRD